MRMDFIIRIDLKLVVLFEIVGFIEFDISDELNMFILDNVNENSSFELLLFLLLFIDFVDEFCVVVEFLLLFFLLEFFLRELKLLVFYF